MFTTRRQFLKCSCGGASLLATGLTLPGFLTRSAWATAQDGPASNGDPILVVIQLTGGNDGLNTVIPIEDDLYHRARPSLRVPSEQGLMLEQGLALHPEMAGMKRLYDDGLLSVVTNVGYPNPDRSHFRSMDIWHRATMSPEAVTDGWLGRVVDQRGAAEKPLALHLDSGALPEALRTQREPVPSIESIEQFRLRSESEPLIDSIEAARQQATEDLLYVQRIAVSSVAQAKRLEQIAAEEGSAAYPQHRLAQRLRQIAQLIAADFGPRIYYTSIDGFDTHARQALVHPVLLRELSESLTEFIDDLSARGLRERVMVMSFSEFGRRVAENGSRGTDHGAGAPMFIAGGSAKPGIVGGPPRLDLAPSHEGDVPHETDFRQVYATVLDEWLRVDSRAVLGEKFGGLPLLG
jgi:uncharacterized protein (DUF1501 family)